MSRFYSTGQFAEKASVSIRTLRYYDQVGLLSPSRYTQAGFRLYTDEDLGSLQQILALKFLGFSLEEIKLLLQTGPIQLQEVLAQQKVMMQEKRAQLDSIIRAVEETEELLRTQQCTWESIAHVIQVIQMEQQKDWVKKYFTDEQIQSMENISRQSYSDEARQKLAARGPWTEEDQRVASQQWGTVSSELKRLVAEGKDPASPEAQTVARLYSELIFQFTQGDPDIQSGLNNWWQNLNEMSEQQRPMQLPYNKEEAEFLGKALEVYKQHQG